MRRPLVFEPLEPRLLLSADPTLTGVLLLEPVLVPETAPPIVLSLEPAVSSIQASPSNVDNLVEVSFSGLVLNRATNTFDTQLTIANTSGETLLAPMRLLVTGIDPEGVTLANQSGQTEAGVPFVDVTLPQGELVPGGQIDNVFLKFANPERVRFTFATDVEAVVEQGDTQAPLIAAALVHDTGRDPADGLTFDPSIGGTVTDASAITSFQAGLDDASSAEFADILDQLEPSGSFTLDQAALEAINGGPLADGTHALHLQASDVAGNTSPLLTVQFALDTTAPTAPTFDLTPSSDTAPTGDQQTTLATVDLTGQTEAGSQVALAETGGAATADATGAFTFSGVALALGPNLFTAHATDAAGNEAVFSRTITRLGEPGEDVTPPAISAILANDTGIDPADGLTTDPTVQGTVGDPSGIAAFRAGLDTAVLANFTDVLSSLAGGSFTLGPFDLDAIAGGSLADGPHTLHLVATDTQGNQSSVFDVAFILDTTAPLLQVNAPGDGATIEPGAHLTGVVDGTGSALDKAAYRFDVLASQPIAVGPDGAFDQMLAVAELSEGPHTLFVSATDRAGNTSTATLVLALTGMPFVVTDHTPLDGESEVGVTVRPQILFSKPVDPTTLNAGNFFASVSGQKLDATIVPAKTGEFAWLFLTDPMPGSTMVEVTVDGSTIRALGENTPLDADSDGTPGGVLTFAFSTVSTTPLLGTALSGRIADAGPDLMPLTADDTLPGPDGTLGTADDLILRPLAGVSVSLLGVPGSSALTGSDGRFEMAAVPAGEMTVLIDGRTATAPPAGFTFQKLNFAASIEPAAANVLTAESGAVYLGRLPVSSFETVDAAAPTVLTLRPEAAFDLTEEQRQQFTLEIEPGSLIGADGQAVSSGQVGLNVIPAELLRALLPAGIPDPVLAFTIDRVGFSDFSAPPQLTLPNLTDAVPGTSFLLLTLDPATGELVAGETLTVVAGAPGIGGGERLALQQADGPIKAGGGGSSISGKLPPGGVGVVAPNSVEFCDLCRTLQQLIGTITIRVAPVPVTSNLHDYFFTKDDGHLELSVGNLADPINPALTDCIPVNLVATPLIVKIEVDGLAGAFLEGLRSETIELRPREIELIDVDMKDFAPQLKNLTADQLYAVHVHVTGFASDAPEVPLIDKSFAIARYVPVVDPAGKEAVFVKTLADQPQGGGFVRGKDVEYHLPLDVTTTITGAGAFNLGIDGPLLGEGTTTWFFDPVSADSQSISTNPSITVGDHTLPHTLTVRGTPVAPAVISPNRSEYEKEIGFYLDDATHFDGTLGVPQASQTFIDLFRPGIPFFNGGTLTSQQLDQRKELINLSGQGLVTAVMKDFEPVNGGFSGYKVVDSGGDVTGVWQSVVVHKGKFVLGLGDIDRDEDRLKQALADPNLPEVAKEYVFAEALNTEVANTITLSFDLNANLWNGNGGFSTFVSATVSHELGHTFGLNEAYVFLPSGNSADLPPFDLMRATIPFDLKFADVNVETLRAAIGLAPETPGALASAITMYRKNFNLPDNTVGIPGTPKVGPPFEAVAALGVSVGDDDLFTGDLLAAGTVLADGAGGEAAPITLTLTNVGLAPLTIGTLAFADGTAGFALAGPSPSGSILDIGESVAVDLVFDPASTGSLTDSLTIESDEPGEPFMLALSGDGLTTAGRIATTLARDRFTGAPIQNNVGGLALGAAPRTVGDMLTVRNIGGGPLTITAVSVAGDAVDQFAVGGLPAGFGPGHPLVLAPRETFALDVTFDAEVTGLQRARIEIASDDPDTPVLRQSVLGTGLPDTGTALDLGGDFVAVEAPSLAGAPVQRTVTDTGGNWELFLPAQARYETTIFDPVSGLVAHGFGVTGESGAHTSILTPVFLASTAPDSDGDGLPDDAEFAIGSSPQSVDTDHDGVSDFAEVNQGLTPLGDRSFPTGIVAGLALRGEAQEIVVEGTRAFVATGTDGLAIVDVTQFDRPILLGRLHMTGVNTDVAVDAARDVAAVSAGAEGLHLVNVADPVRPALVRTLGLPGGAGPLEALDGVVYAGSGSALVAVEIDTGAVLQTLDLGGGPVTGLAREGTQLFTMDATQTLRVVDVSNGTMQARGALTLPEGGGQIFVGNGIAYVAAASGAHGGFATVDVSDPDAPVLLSGSDVVSASAPSQAIVANGSGRAVLIGTAGAVNALDLMDVSDATETNRFQARIPLPATPRSVALASGIAFVADGSAGLQIVNYVSFDSQGQAPTVTISATPADVDPTTPGIQVRAGTTIPVLASVSDDVQVRSAELIANGHVLRDDVSFPYDFSAIVPGDATQFTLQVRATDTGGNEGLSNTLTFSVVPDTVAPEIVGIDPGPGASVPEGSVRVQVRFSEALATGTVSADTFTLEDAQGNAIAPLGVRLASDDRIVNLTYGSLAAGHYTIAIDAGAVTDRAGNPLGTAEATSDFIVAAEATKRWINPAGGVWDDPDNWEGGTLPGPTDKVLIDVPAEVTVVHRTGATVIESLLSREAFELVGGTLRVASTIEVDNSFTVGTSTGVATLADATVLPGAGGEGLVISDTGVLDDVTLVADATIADGSEMQARNGLTLDGARVTLESGAAAATVFFLNTQTLGGTGDLFFGGTSDQGEILTGGLLTIGPGVTIRGSQSGVVSGFDESVPSLALQGAILAETAGETIEVSETTNWTNAGVVGATNGARLTMDGIVRFEGAGTFKASGGEVLLVGTLDNTGKTLALTAATGSLVTAGPARIVGGRLVFSGGATLDVGPVTLDGVTLASDLVIEGRPFGSRPGRVTVENGLTLEDAVITLSDNVLFGQPDLTFDGTQTLSGTGGIVFSGSFSNGVVGVADFTSGDTLTIAPGITVRASGDGDLDGIINQSVIIAESDRELSLLSAVNQGTLQGLSGSTLDLRDFTNAGTVVVAGIAHMSSGDYVQTAGQTELQGTLTGNVDIRGGTLSGVDSPFVGAISGNLRNAGQITLGTAADRTGTLSVGGAFEQTAAGTLSVDIAGTTTADFDRLQIKGTATLAGTLDVHLVGGFVPAVGDTFDILTFASRTGNFASVTGLSLPDGNTLQFTAEATGIRLITVSGPVLDTLPPAILEIDPADGASEPEGLQVVQVRFSEALNPATVTASTFRVVRAGQTQAALGVDLLDQGSLVRLRFAGLAAGDYQIVIDADAVTDLAGNALGGPDVTSDFSLVGEQVTWINPVGGFWDDPANWSGGALPGPGDNVVIDVPGDVTITHRTGTTVINRLISHESLALTGGTLDVATTLQVDGAFTLAFSTTGTILRHATVVPGTGGQDVLIISSATLDGVTLAANLTVADLGTADVRNGLTLDGARLTLASDGNPTMLFFHDDQALGGTGEVFFGGTGTGNAVDVDGGVLTIGPGITIRGSQGGGVGHSFGNETIVLAGTVLAETAGKTIVVDGNGWVNTGLVRATNGGRLELDGTFTLEGGGTFSASGGAVVLVGTLDNTGRTLAITAATGSLQADGGTIRGGRIETTGGALLVAQVAMTLDGVTLGSNFSLQDGGAVMVTNGLTLDHVTVTLLDGTVPFIGPRIRFDGTQALGGTGDIVFGGTGDAGAVVAGSGATLTIGSGITIHGPRGGSVGVLGSLVNEGTISAQANAIEITVNGSSVTNKGTVQAMNGGRILLAGGPFTNTGGVTASAGSIVRLFSGTYLQTAGETSLAGGTLTASTVSIQGGVLSGFGTVSGNLINAALVDIGAPTGTLQVTGTYLQTAAGTLKVGLGGAGAGQFDRLQITGAATLGGTLDVGLVGGFLPAVGNTFEILTFASRTGDFGTITGLTLPDGHTLQESLEATRVRLITV